MSKIIPEGYEELFDVIADVLDADKFDSADSKCIGLYSKANNAIQKRRIKFFVMVEGVRYLHLDSFRKWALSYVDDARELELKGLAKIKSLQQANELTIANMKLEKDNALIKNVETFSRNKERKGDALRKQHAMSHESKTYCISTARGIWDIEGSDDDDVYTVGEVCEMLLEQLRLDGKWCPTSSKKIRQWLNEARKEGSLFIPDVARRRGRPQKITK